MKPAQAKHFSDKRDCLFSDQSLDLSLPKLRNDVNDSFFPRNLWSSFQFIQVRCGAAMNQNM